MTIKLLLLKSGEDIIANVSEMAVGEKDSQRVVGYFVEKPVVVKLKDSHLVDEETKTALQVSLYPWMPLTKTDKIPLSLDWVVTMVDPIDKLKQMYVEDIVNYGKDNQGDSTNESSSSDSGD
tara:strand:- start:468 stop:833 length:366 start_codon:yes stop_codon:yes gene_type:complete